jgi:hypothetical protein
VCCLLQCCITKRKLSIYFPLLSILSLYPCACRGYINISTIEGMLWLFMEGGEQGGTIRDRSSMDLPSFRSHGGGGTLHTAIIRYNGNK